MWDDTLRVNLTGVFHCTRAALPGADDVAVRADRQHREHGGLDGLSVRGRVLRGQAWRRRLDARRSRSESRDTHITVNAVCPGYTDTSIVDDAIANIVAATGRSPADARDALLRRNPQRRLVAPEEVAATVAWLCLPESQSINGQAISLSGGEVMAG